MLSVYIDGGARGNPGPAAAGFVVVDERGVELHRYGKLLGTATNNCAEYAALIEALKYLSGRNLQPPQDAHEGEGIVIFSDSELLVRHMHGHYRVRDKKLIPLFHEAKDLIATLGEIRIEYISRKKNRPADIIVNRVLDGLEYDT